MTTSKPLALWRLVFVTPDEVSSTVLTYGLRPDGEGWRDRALRERADHHAEVHVTPRDLRDLRLQLPAATLIHICENPRVVEAAADAACVQPLVCTSGNAATWEPSGSRSAPRAPPTPPKTVPPQHPDQAKRQTTRCRSWSNLIRDEEVVGSNPATPTLVRGPFA
ncbi:DUF2399 domain-containing protein [Streptomyces canus]|uniref:DUF2399 domain-containing protein n=1 Tax=Streptomyces canus TaxID=58343 RepID=UPI0033BC2DA0